MENLTKEDNKSICADMQKTFLKKLSQNYITQKSA